MDYGCDVFACTFPRQIDCSMVSSVLLAAGDSIIMHRSGSFRRRRVPRNHAIYVYNRLTRSWSEPIDFPGDYAIHRLWEIRCLGIVQGRTLVTMCWPFGSDHSLHSLVWFTISEQSDALTACASADLGEQPRSLTCIACIPQAHNKLCMVFKLKDASERDIVLVTELYGSSIVSQRTTQFEPNCDYAMLSNGKLFLICYHADTGVRLFMWKEKGAPELISAFHPRDSFPEAESALPSAVHLTHSANHLFATFLHYGRSQVESGIFDTATRQWAERRLTTANCTVNPYRTVNGPFDGEILLSVSSSSSELEECGLYSMWFEPQKLTTIAVQAIHRALPEGSLTRLGCARNVQCIADFVRFLYSPG